MAMGLVHGSAWSHPTRACVAAVLPGQAWFQGGLGLEGDRRLFTQATEGLS